MDHRLNTIAMLCRSFLFNYEHEGRKALAEDLVRQLHRATLPAGPPVADPPTLGVRVGDAVATEDRAGG